MFFYNNSSSFIKKDMYVVSSKSFLYALIFGGNIHKGLIFLALLDLIGDLIRYTYFINMYFY